jgi:clan AA aspartic protease (TIGR02281 family)
VFSAGGAAGEVYRWTDDDGREHFSGTLSEVPASRRAEALDSTRREATPSRLQTFEAPAAKARGVRARGGPLHIPYEAQGNAMLVQVRINDRVTAPFYVDTGAGDVVLPAAVAARAGVMIGPDTPREIYGTANGFVRQPVVTLEAVEVGEARVENVRGSVSESMPVGLLGTSFFNHFTMQIDPAARVLTLTPNPNMHGGVGQAEWSERFRTLRARQARIEAYLEDGALTDDDRARELAKRRDEIAAELEALEDEANRAEVPAAWRE